MNEKADQIIQMANTLAETFRPEEPDTNGRAIYTFNGLATPPKRAIRSFFGLFGKLDVPPGAKGVCYTPDSPPYILDTGTHWFNGARGAATLVQWVDVTRRRHLSQPVTGICLDGWNVTLQVTVIYEVNDPIQAAGSAEPIATLEAVVRAVILAQIETMPHEALLGTVDTPRLLQNEDNGGSQLEDGTSRGLDRVERGILERLISRPSLEGLMVVDVAVVSREGDNRLVDILQNEALARLQVVESHETETARSELSKIRLEMQVHTAQAQRAVSLIDAETQAQLATFEQQKRLLEARTEAKMQEIRQAQEAREAERKRMAEEWRTAKELDLKSMEYQHAETVAIIQGTAQITTEAAKSGMLSSAIQGNSRRIEVGGDNQGATVEAGIQALRMFREKSTPPTTYFLPKPAVTIANPGTYPASRSDRIEEEALHLERIRYADHELIVRHGLLAGARVWFLADAPSALADARLEFQCPENYPFTAPQANIIRAEETQAYPVEK